MPRNAAKKTNKTAKNRLPVLIKVIKNQKKNLKRNLNKATTTTTTTTTKGRNKAKKTRDAATTTTPTLTTTIAATTFTAIAKSAATTITQTAESLEKDSLENILIKANTTTANNIKSNSSIQSNKSDHQKQAASPDQQQQQQLAPYFTNIPSKENSSSNFASDSPHLKQAETLLCLNETLANNKDSIETFNSLIDTNQQQTEQQQQQHFNSSIDSIYSNSIIADTADCCNSVSISSLHLNNLIEFQTDDKQQPEDLNTSSLYPIVIEASFEDLSNPTTTTTTAHSNNNSSATNKNLTSNCENTKRVRNRRFISSPECTTARLSSLRTRKLEEPPAAKEKKNKTKKPLISATSAAAAAVASKSSQTENDYLCSSSSSSSVQANQIDENNTSNNSSSANSLHILIRKAPVVIDAETFNKIETLNDNEVKKPTNKRKRNQTAILLGLSVPQPRSSKRVSTATAATQQAAVILGKAAVVGGGGGGGGIGIIAIAAPPLLLQQQEKLTGNVIHNSNNNSTLVITTAAGSQQTITTNIKKRPKIMSLYERPFQAGNDGRAVSGGVGAGNGYLSSTSSRTAGGGSGSLMINDLNDTQDMSGSQYYLSGSAGGGSVAAITAANVNTVMVVGNGSAINHAPTMATLCNIGNTCYLNSVVYTLRFAPQFLHNLHHLLADLNALQQNVARAKTKSSSLNRGLNASNNIDGNARSWSSKDLASVEQYSNATASATAAAAAAGTSPSSALSQVTQKSSHQVLTEKLHELYQSLHRNEMNESTEPHHSDTLLHAIQDVSTIFEGNQQQDAHEFLMCVLNSIRETSQTLIKAVAECPDVILNGYISNPDELEALERDANNSKFSSGNGSASSGGVGGGSSGGVNSLLSNSATAALSSLTSSAKSTSFFSRKSKRKDEAKNSKNSRLQSPLKDGLIAAVTGVTGGGTSNTTNQSNSLFYLNANDLNSTGAAAAAATAAATTTPQTSPFSSNSSTSNNSQQHLIPTAVQDDAMDTTPAGNASTPSSASPASLALLLKDKQRLEERIRELGLDFFNEDFEGITVSTTKCLSCETITEQKETMIDIAVPVPQAGYDSNEYMDRPSSFIQNSCITREYFRNENKYRCEQCCGYTEAIRSISYEVLPRLLVIQLSRFSGGMEKINSYIPTSFTLQCFCSKCCELSDANKLHIYKLYSVITHVGATMSVGHYIAYTCSLDWANEYVNCPKEMRKRRASQENASKAANLQNATAHAAAAAAASATSSNSGSGSSSATGFMKMKIKFGRSKASSSGDMSKNVKHLNGLTNSGAVGSGSKAITNGINKLSMNVSSTTAHTTPSYPTTCPSINCCAMRLSKQQQQLAQDLSNEDGNHTFAINGLSASAYSAGSASSSSGTIQFNNNNQQYNHQQQQQYSSANISSSGYGSTGRGGGSGSKIAYASSTNIPLNSSSNSSSSNNISAATTHTATAAEPIWYMCDDDKIKAMTQREFEELLSPARKITITPYLLFYARYDLQATTSSPPKSATSLSSVGGGVIVNSTTSPQTSWSNESLQSSSLAAVGGGVGAIVGLPPAPSSLATNNNAATAMRI